MSWISTVAPADAEGELAMLYQRLGAKGSVDHILQAHSLRPHTLEGHLALYRSVLHHPRNRLDRAFAEALGVYVSRINACDYCIAHHEAGLKRELQDGTRFQAWRQALISGAFDTVFDARQRRALDWADLLTRTPGRARKHDIQALREAGWDDGEILEINQVVAYFNYANRTVLGLGVSTEGEGRPGLPTT
ncbi:MAG: peroxidase-related enzyme [Wenzhouxiangellaceae bacterium]|nr:peroxidase-related enzyme [Wenzhouxiangellaceae bacterium]